MLQSFVESAKELKKVQTIAIGAMLIALNVVLGVFSITIGEFLKVGFSFIANELAGFMFGPIVGAVVAGSCDLIKFAIRPTGPYFFGFTLNALLAGAIYGAILYKKPLTLKRVFLANVLVAIFINLLLSTYWLSIMYGKGFLVLLPARGLKQLIKVPIDAILFYTVAKQLDRINHKRG